MVWHLTRGRTKCHLRKDNQFGGKDVFLEAFYLVYSSTNTLQVELVLVRNFMHQTSAVHVYPK